MQPLRPWPRPASAEDELVALYAQDGVTREMLFGQGSAPDAPEDPPAAPPADRPRGRMTRLTEVAVVVARFLRPVLPFDIGRRATPEEAAAIDRAVADVDAQIAQLDRTLATMDRSLARGTPYCSRGENYCTGGMHYTCRACGESDLCYMTVHFCRRLEGGIGG